MVFNACWRAHVKWLIWLYILLDFEAHSPQGVITSSAFFISPDWLTLTAGHYEETPGSYFSSPGSATLHGAVPWLQAQRPSMHSWISRLALEWYEDVAKGSKLLHMFFGVGVQICMHTCRPSILDLAERFQSAGDWASERVFDNWVNKQPWRKCLPQIYEFTVKRVTSLTLCIFQFLGFWVSHEAIKTINVNILEKSVWKNGIWKKMESKANLKVHSKLTHVRLGVLFPHEIAAAFYDFGSGDLFYNLLTGTPAASWWHVFLIGSFGNIYFCNLIDAWYPAPVDRQFIP